MTALTEITYDDDSSRYPVRIRWPRARGIGKLIVHSVIGAPEYGYIYFLGRHELMPIDERNIIKIVTAKDGEIYPDEPDQSWRDEPLCDISEEELWESPSMTEKQELADELSPVDTTFMWLNKYKFIFIGITAILILYTLLKPK